MLKLVTSGVAKGGPGGSQSPPNAGCALPKRLRSIYSNITVKYYNKAVNWPCNLVSLSRSLLVTHYSRIPLYQVSIAYADYSKYIVAIVALVTYAE